MAKQLSGGVFRSDLKLSDERDIYYYDSKEISRTAVVAGANAFAT